MMIEIKLSDNSRIYYETLDRFLRRYTFEYITFNDLKFEIKYDIYLTTKNFKDMFKVKSFMQDDMLLETYNDAVAYIYRNLNNEKARIDAEQTQIQATIKRKNKG